MVWFFLVRRIPDQAGLIKFLPWNLEFGRKGQRLGFMCPEAMTVKASDLLLSPLNHLTHATVVPSLTIYFYIYIYFLLCWVFVSVRGLSLVVASGGHSSSRCAGLSLSWPLLLRSVGSRHAGSVVVAHGPSCSAACGILPDQGSNLCPLHWQAASQPLRHQGSPCLNYLMDFTSDTIWHCGDILYYEFNFFNRHSSLWAIHFSLVSFGKLCFPKNWSRCWSYWHKVVYNIALLSS